MRHAPDALMLFAAGFGTRMGALTRDVPKPLIPVAGRPLIDHALDLVEPLGLGRVVANVHYHADMMARHLAARDVLVSREAPKILETGGGLKAALPLLGDGAVFTLNSDAVWLGANPLELLRAAWQADRMDALLLCVDPARAVGHAGQGDFLADEGSVARRGPGLIYTGAQIVKTGGLAAIDAPVFSLNILWDRMLRDGTLHVLRYPGRWCDVGTPEGIALAETLLECGDV